MSKISIPVLNLHNQAVELLKKESLNFCDREFIFDNYHEGAGQMNNLISAHFTPYSICRSLCQNITYTDCFVDLCAGIGMISYALKRYEEMSFNKPIFGICIEKCTEYYEVGKKLLPEFHWINGDCFDPEVIEQVKELMKGKKFSVISNPPYGNQVKTDSKELLKYTGSTFEYKAIELGAILGAYDGAFLIPQVSAPFRISGVLMHGKKVYEEEYKTKNYKKFVEQTGLEISHNNGYDTVFLEEGEAWRDVSIPTEIACLEYEELNYVAKQEPVQQIGLFDSLLSA